MVTTHSVRTIRVALPSAASVPVLRAETINSINACLSDYSLELAFATKVTDADLAVSTTINGLFDCAKAGFKGHFLVWTHEPRYNTSRNSIISVPHLSDKVHIMNVYTGDVFTTPLFYFPFTKLDIENSYGRAPGVFMGTYRSYFEEYTPSGEFVDLNIIRQNLALYLRDNLGFELYGPGYPKHLGVTEAGRTGDWQSIKRKILSRYSFNLALENTNTKYYVTEKIWNAIECGCVPIYFGGNSGIEEIISNRSFIDASQFESFEQIGDYIKSLGKADVKEYVRSGRKDWSMILKNFSPNNIRHERIRFFAAKIQMIFG
ncbi:glycosyltransferase family 10 domain-containing protein [Bauldia litoralis]|uniref:Glycosyltransferase family 10 (Fucosyltransferase) C-term n=1 Tax=Bauldia litoralis TaxID=665467 RepID=A0A1G6CW17_9HYPH|nr:glycosyltransferase family 10 [Bauldia litoralis]SDB37056.1 Glycosyltransferase family 10 (fucosyltransferase) C-term [Bauldia litoralis]